MGFIKMLFFRKGKSSKEKEKIKIHYSELKEQIENLIAEPIEEFEENVRMHISEIAAAKADIKRSIPELEEAKLMNDKIPVKEKHFMEGNRAAYVKVLNMFLKELNEPEDISEEEIKAFLEEYESASKDFRKASARPGHITNNFFAKELSKIASDLHVIEESVKNLEELMKREDVQNIFNSRKCMKQLIKEIDKREELLSDIEAEEKSYEDIKTEKAYYEHKILNKKKDQTYVQLGELKERIKSVDSESKILTAEFINSFLQIEKALKKFPKGNDDTEKLICSYLENPVQAVLNDPDLKIMKVLGEVNIALKNGNIEMDDKKKDKIIEKIEAIDSKMFTSFIIKYNDLQLKKSEAERILKQNTSQRDIDDLQYRLDHTITKQKSSIEKIKKLDSQIENLQIAELKETIETGMKELGVPIEIQI
ncbi:hypothetical protein KY308_03100 [Candidatus Woesearchaeota archaeon]|nr:hypothetical protein [Candidatus Woesearchaeota archaeon]